MNHKFFQETMRISIDLLFPPRCPVCRGILTPEQGKVHEICRKKLKFVTEPICMLCGKPIDEKEKEYCGDCLKRRHYFDGGRAVWIYEQYIRQSIVWYKYKHCMEFADYYILELYDSLEEWLGRIRPEIIIPIPLNKKKRRLRGYNQAQLLAERLGKKLNCPVNTDLLLRSHWTEPQKSLTPAQRYENLKRAFCIKGGERISFGSVLLIDDIYTTGSTIDACAHLLKSYGAGKVYFAALCIGSEAD